MNLVKFHDVFDDEFYDLLNEDEDTDDMLLVSLMEPHIGDLLIYSYKLKKFSIMPKSRAGIENDKAIVGIVILQNDNATVDVIFKNFITKNPIAIPLHYYNKPKNIPAYLKDLFDRYGNKYKRDANIDLTEFKYGIPTIGLLDFMNRNINTILETIKNIWGTERYIDFYDRLYNNGVLSTHKNKFYKWKPNKDSKREILNLEALAYIEFLPVFNFTYK